MLLGDITEQQRQVEAELGQWVTYNEGAESVEKWMIDMEACVKRELELKDTLAEKRAQLQQHKVRE